MVIRREGGPSWRMLFHAPQKSSKHTSIVMENESQVDAEMLFSVTHVSAKAIPMAKGTPRASVLRIGIEGMWVSFCTNRFNLTAVVHLKV